MTAPSDVPDFNASWSSPRLRRETTAVRECVFEVCVGVIPVSFAPLSSALVSQELLIFVVSSCPAWIFNSALLPFLTPAAPQLLSP